MNPQDPISAIPPPHEAEEQVVRRGEPNLEDPQYYFNRELSWLRFNERVLELAEDASVPLMERLKFAAIFTSNLDEFFMIRVAGLHDQVDAGLANTGADGRTPSETIDAIHERAGELSDRHAACVATALRPALSEQGIAVVSWDALDGSQRHVIKRCGCECKRHGPLIADDLQAERGDDVAAHVCEHDDARFLRRA